MKKLFAVCISLISSAPFLLLAQTGPGGVGNASGASGQPHNVLWLRSNTGISSSGGFVDTWTDQSGNSNNATGLGATRPTFNAVDANFNGFPSISFPNTAAANFFLEVADNDNLDNTAALSVFFVTRATSTTLPATSFGVLSKRTNSAINQSYVFQYVNFPRFRANTGNSGVYDMTTSNTTLASKAIVSFLMNGTALSSRENGNTATQNTGAGPATLPNNASNLFIGSFDNITNANFEGEIVEVIIFRTLLNEAQRTIIENYLSAKYDSPLSPAADVYAGDNPGGTTLNHDFDLAGIGFNGGGSHFLANSAGLLLSPSAGTINLNGEFVLTAHNGVSNSAVVTDLGTGGVVQRWNRTWYIDRTPATGIDANIAFDFSDGISGQFPQNKNNYVLLRRNTGNGLYDVVASIGDADKTLVGDQISFRVPDAELLDGVYTLGTLDATASPVAGASNRTWYSYQSGNWVAPASWTLDGGLTPLLVNPSNEIPGITDNVVITSGRTITMVSNNIQINSLEVTGTLNLQATSGHNFVTVSGPGRIRIAGATDNLPIASYTAFADAINGGTLEINGTGIALNQARAFRNIEINLTNSTDVATLEENYTINGELRILNGLFRFNNDIAVANRTCTVNGNVTVAATGGIRTGLANARHEFNLNGNFTNDGTAFFTQRTDDSQRNAAEATNGIVDVNMISASQDQQLTCNGVTRFYRIEINKGIDETYKVTLSASAPANFGLFGRAAYDINTVSGANDNAIGLRNGTLEVGSNVAIPHLNTGGNYAIFETAQLWVNGGSVTKSGGTAIVPYGRLKVTTGTLTALIGSGITTRENGIIQIEGGTVDVGAIRTSVAGAGAVGSYIQSGGTVTVTGTGGISADYAVFSLTYPGNVFNMSGGTLIVRNRPTDLGTGTLRGSIFINSDPPNVSVTGGTVIADINSTVAYKITSRAPFWNLILRNSLDATLRDIELLGTTSGVGGGAGEPTLAAQNLVVRGGLIIENNTRLDHNGRNLNIAGNLTIQATGDLIYDGSGGGGRRNITTLDGTDNATLTFLNRTGGTGDEQDFWSLVINKPADKVVSLASGKTNLAGTNNNLINVQGDAFKLFSGTLDQGFHSVRLFCDTILNYQTVGVWSGATTVSGTVSNDANDMIRFRNNPTPTVLLTTPNAVFGAVRFNRAGAPMKLNSNLRIQLLEYLFGKWDIGTHRLTIDRMVGNNANFSEPPPGDRTEADSLNNINPLPNFGLFSVEDMIVTTGNSSDGGLAIRVFANGSYRFPLGLGTTSNDGANTPGTDKYTPALATVTGFSDDGYIIINPVNSVLQTTNLSGGPDILNYYWRVRFEGFTTLPTVKYQFTYAQGDAAGTETNYLPGKVLDIGPFTRSSEAASVNTTSNIIHFDGAGTGFTLEQANYTAGAASRFTGSPEIYYTKRGGDGFSLKWNNPANWTLAANGSLPPHHSGQADATDFPQAGDIAIVGFVPFTDPVVARRGQPHGISIDGITANIAELRFTQLLNSSNNPTARVYAFNFQFRPTVNLNNPGTQGQLINAKVSGEGMFWIRSDGGNLSDPNFAGVDLGDFNLRDSSYVVYENTINGATYVNLPSTFPNLMMATNGWGAVNNSATIAKDITVNGDLEILGDANLLLSTGATGNITVNRNLRFFRSNANSNDSGDGGELRFGNTGTPRTVTILGNLLLGNGNFGSGSVIRIGAPDGAPIIHTINLHGNFIQNTGGNNTDVVPNGNGFKAGISSANDRINLILRGNTSMVMNNVSGDVPQFYSINVTKGNSIATTASFNSPFTLDGPSDQAVKSLVLSNGLFVINSASTVTLTSGGANFSIPSKSGLDVRLGTARTTTTSANANILLDGLLRVSGGTVDVNGGGATDTNFIEYSNSGNSVIEVTSGTLTVAGKIRRATTSVTGVLRYTQSGGTVLIANESGTGSDDRGVFEVVNPGSQFNHSGGSFTIVQGINSTTIPSLLIEPASASITSGSTITIGNGSTPAGANSQNIGIKSTVTLNNLTIAGTNNPVARIYVSPLNVANNLIVGSGTTLNANNQNLSIGGNFTVDGSYVPTSNTTSFTNTGAAAISGATPLFNFFNFSKSGAGTLTVSKDITVNQDLSVLAGTLATSSFAINLKRNALIDATIASTSGSGLVFNGSLQQQLTRSVNGTSSLGIVTVNNAAGVVVPDGNGYTFTVTSGLRLQQGVFDIGGSLLSLTTTALITPVSPFSVTNMIQTNSSFTDQGVRKQFPIGTTSDFTFPVGQLAYTPVIFNFSSPTFTSGTSVSTVTVRPANEIHPAIVNDDELPAGAGPEDFDDLLNALAYHWIINADNVTGMRSIMTLQYAETSVLVTAPRTEALYIPARILSDANPSGLINKFTTAELDETLNLITFNFLGISDGGISGQYFAGVDLAIPDNVPVYTTTGSGNVNAPIYFPVVPGGGAPRGATVIVAPGHTVTLNAAAGFVSLYETQISAGATITIPSGSIGHRLGTITGTGNLRIEVNFGASAAFPAAVYDDFFSCSGGGLIFAGTGNYDILGGITSLRNLTLEGTGTKNLPSNDVTICNDLTITAGSLTNTSSRNITILNDFLLNAGTYNNNSGTLAITRDFVQASGAYAGGSGGAKTIGRNLTITGGTFTPGSGTTNIITINGNMTVAPAATIVTGTGGSTGQRFRFTGSGVQTLTGDFTSTRAFNRLEISNSAGLVLAGNTTVFSELLLTTGNITPGANTLLMESSAIATPSEGRATSFVNGKLFKALAAGTVTPNATNSFTFPIGSGSRWRSGSVTVANLSTAATWDMQYFTGNADAQEAIVTNMTPIAPVVRLATGEYWKVSDGSVAATGRAATIGLSWGIESDVNVSTVEQQDLRVMQWVGAPTNQWQNRGGINFSAGRTQARGTFTASSTISFSEQIVTLGSEDTSNPLPVTLVKFEGRLDGSIASLNWKTASEINNDYFEVQRSSDGLEFIGIGKVVGNGTTNLASEYFFEDRSLMKGNNYYRLKQFDFDGKSSYSNVIVLDYDGSTPLNVFLYPNPTNTQNINLELINPSTEYLNIRILDITGRVSLQTTISAEELESNISLKPEELKAGVYVVEVIQGTQRVTKRLVIHN